MDNVFATKMPAGMDEAAVTALFNLYGQVTSVKIVSKIDQAWTAALVRFATDDEAAFVVNNLNGNVPQGLTNPIEATYANSSQRGGKGAQASARSAPYSNGLAAPMGSAPWTKDPQSGAPSDNIFITKLPQGWDEAQVAQLMNGYGTVTSTRIVSRPDQAYTSALVRFATLEEATWLVENLAGQIPQGLGSPVDLRFASAGQEKGGKGGGSSGSSWAPATNDNVYVTNLPAGVDEATVAALFNSYGKVVSTKIVSKPEFPGTSALVRFSTPEEAEFVVKNLDGNIPQGITTPVNCAYSKSGNAGPGGGGGGGGGWSDGGWGKGGKGGKGYDDGSMENVLRWLGDNSHFPGGNGRDFPVHELFIHGLPADTTDLHLYQLSAPFGQISPKGCKVMVDKERGTCIGYGFVNFLSEESANLMITSLNMVKVPGGRTLKVQYKQRKGPDSAPRAGVPAPPPM